MISSVHVLRILAMATVQGWRLFKEIQFCVLTALLQTERLCALLISSNSCHCITSANFIQQLLMSAGFQNFAQKQAAKKL